MKVKVIKSKMTSNWYNDKIGEIFEVKLEKYKYGSDFLWDVVNANGYRIWEEDCVVVSEKPTQTKLFRMIRMENSGVV